MKTSKRFGDLFRELRLKNRYTLRAYCRKFNRDPAYISRIERGITPPPENSEEIENYARSFNLEEGSRQWIEFYNLAVVSRKKKSEPILSEKELVGKLPLFVTTTSGKPLDNDKLDKLIDIIRD